MSEYDNDADVIDVNVIEQDITPFGDDFELPVTGLPEQISDLDIDVNDTTLGPSTIVGIPMTSNSRVFSLNNVSDPSGLLLSRDSSQRVNLSIRDVIEQFYLEYNPEKVSTIDMILQRYEGNEAQLMKHLKEKYKIDKFEPFEVYNTAVTGDDKNDVKQEEDSKVQSSINLQSTQPVSSISSPSAVLMSSLSVPDLTGLSNDIASRFMTGWVSINSISSKDTNQTPISHIAVNSSKDTINSPQKSNMSDPGQLASARKVGHATADPAVSTTNTTSKIQDNKDVEIDKEKSNIESSMKQLKSQNAILKTENSKLKNDLNDVNSRLESTSKYGVFLAEKESNLVRENQNLLERIKHIEMSKKDLDSQYKSLAVQNANKHKQLVETVKLTHKLGAQLRFLAAKAYRNFDFSQSDNVSNQSRNGEFLDKSSDVTSVKDIPIDFCVDCVKYGVLCDKLGLSSLSAFTQNREIKSTTNSHDDEITLVEDSSNGTNDISDIDVTIVDMNRDSDLSGELGDKDELIKELRLMIKSLHSAYTSGRTELMITIQENSSLELRTVEQQAQIIDLNNKLTKLAHELNTASGSADFMKKQINEAQNEAEQYKLQLELLTRRFKDSEECVAKANEDIRQLKEALLLSNATKKDLAKIYSDHIKNSDADAMEYIKQLSERLLLEREDMLSRMTAVFEHDRDVRGIFQLEIQREMHRLREELFKSRRAEAQREREMAFLQTQLIDAVERISTLDGRVRDLADAKKQLEEIHSALNAAAASSSTAAASIKAFNAWRLGKK